MQLYLGVDAGGSHCRARITDAGGKVLGVGQSGPANTRMGIDPLYDRLVETCTQATQSAGLSDADVAKLHAGMGIAGITRMGAKQKLKAKPFPFASLTLTSDAIVANLGAHLGGDGATLILGTGSIGIIKLGEDIFSIGGYGFPISDEGSGAALGLSAIRHALRALDGRSRTSPLSQAVTRQFDHVTARVVAWMDEATPGDYATFAPLVMEFAENGDETARSIVSEAARHVERFIETIFARGATRCALAGGLSTRMRGWLRARVANRICDPLGDPLDGALLLAGRPTPGMVVE